MRHGARPDRSRGNALMSAVCEGFRHCARAAAQRRRKVSKERARSKTATSPLHCAAERGDIELVESSFASVAPTSSETALEGARSISPQWRPSHMRAQLSAHISSYLRVIEALIKHGAVVEADGYSAIVPSHATTEKLLRNLNFYPEVF